MKWKGKFVAKRGDVACIVVETKDDFPSDVEGDRQWIYIKNCRVIQPD
jgi:hypothetical protein